MSETDIHPYSLEVAPSARRPGLFEWAIRRNGKLVERSDRFATSEADAQKAGLKAVERLFLPSHNSR